MVGYEIQNPEQFNALLGKLKKASSSIFLMNELSRIVKKFSTANFTLKGSGQYPKLSARYKKRKSRINPSAPILVYSGALRDSIIKNTSDTISEITKFSARIGTSLPYATFHDTGTSKMPMRKPLFLTDKMVAQMIKTYEAHIEKEIIRL